MSRFLVGTRGPRVREPDERAAHTTDERAAHTTDERAAHTTDERAAHTTDERAAHPYLANSNRVTHFPRVPFLCGRG